MIGVAAVSVNFNLFKIEFPLGDLPRAARTQIGDTQPAIPNLSSRLTPSLLGPPVGKIIKNGFDCEYYLRTYPDIKAAGVEPWSHYKALGCKELRNPNAYFAAVSYLANYPDVAKAKVDPFDHYMEIGWREGRNPSHLFTTWAYLVTYPDVAASGLNPFEHFLMNGVREGRSPCGN